MGKRGVPVVNLGSLRIRDDLGKKVLLMLEDPTKPGRTKYGEMRKYIEGLIANDMHKRQAISDDLLKEVMSNVE